MEFLVGLRWWWRIVGGGGFPAGFAVGGRGGGGGSVSGGFGVRATCHPPEECVIRDSKWISRLLAEKKREREREVLILAGRDALGRGLSLRMRKRSVKKDDPKANCKSFSFFTERHVTSTF